MTGSWTRLSNYKWELLQLCEKSQGPHLPAKGVQPHHGPIVRAERPHRICQDLLQGEQDLLIEATYKVPMSPAGATFSQGNEAQHCPAGLKSQHTEQTAPV